MSPLLAEGARSIHRDTKCTICQLTGHGQILWVWGGIYLNAFD